MNWIRSALGLKPVSEPLVWLQRRETWAGDLKANLIRVSALFIFGVNEMFIFYFLKGVSASFHRSSLLLVAIWLGAAIAHQMALKNHWLPKSGSVLMVACDVFLLTRLILAGGGLGSSLVGIYFLIVALTALRLNPKFVLMSTGLCVWGYLAVLGSSPRPIGDIAPLSVRATITVLCLLFQGAILSHGIGRVMDLMKTSQTGSSNV